VVSRSLDSDRVRYIRSYRGNPLLVSWYALHNFKIVVFPEQPRAGLSVRAYLVALFSLRPAPAGGRLPPPPSARWWEPFPPLVGSDIRVSKLWYPLKSKRSRAASRTPLTWVKTKDPVGWVSAPGIGPTAGSGGATPAPDAPRVLGGSEHHGAVPPRGGF
jgi:hypothetical protein